MRQAKQDRSRELLDKYMEYYEKKVRRGVVSPMNGVERLTIEMCLHWLCERYIIAGNQK